MISQKLTDNKWGFSVADDNPFAIFRYLQNIAVESVGSNNVIDLSRGDPGYGFTPSVNGRKFYAYLLMVDAFLNNDKRRFVDYTEDDFESILEEIGDFSRNMFDQNEAKIFIEQLEKLIKQILRIAQEEALKWSEYDVLNALFKFCPASGGSYLNPQGEKIVRLVVADRYRKFIDTPLKSDDLILFNGASHAIGTLFKALGKSGIDYLNEDGVVVICSPAYAPYNASLLNRSIKTFALAINPVNGKISDDNLDHLENMDEKVKAIIMIDPNNPTGFSIEDKTLERIAGIAKQHDCIIISDEVYTSFFPKKKTIVDYAPERTLRIDARSKIERSTGLRFGDLFISKEANGYVSEVILKKYLAPGQNLKSLLIQAKGPGGIDGELQHTTFVPGPAQFLGMAHMIFGGDERGKYFESVSKNTGVFMETLGMEKRDSLYYVIFDLNEIKGCKKGDAPVEEKLTELAKLGVVYLPVYLFFSELERNESASLNMVRASIVNTNYENVIRAAEITKNYLSS